MIRSCPKTRMHIPCTGHAQPMHTATVSEVVQC